MTVTLTSTTLKGVVPFFSFSRYFQIKNFSNGVTIYKRVTEKPVRIDQNYFRLENTFQPMEWERDLKKMLQNIIISLVQCCSPGIPVWSF